MEAPRMTDIRLIVICDPSGMGPTALQAVLAAEAGGATLLQLRMKNSAAADQVRWAERLISRVRIPVWINDRADVALAAGAAGVHLGQDDLPPARLRGIAPPPFGVGVSVGNDAEAAAVADVAIDYWSIGSIYATPSKADAGEPIGTDGLSHLVRRAPRAMPIVAIGGITAERVTDVCAAGADGVAVISAVFGAPDPERAARRLRDAVDAATGGRS